jgi:hypothetical protein
VHFGLLNEPNAGGNNQLDATAWNSLLADAVEVVRQTNPDRPIVVGPSDWNLPRAIGTLELPDDDHLIATVHFYEPFPFTHQGADWMAGAEEWVGTPWNGTDEEKAAVDSVFDALAAWSADENVPMYVGEFGAYSEAPLADRARWTEYVRRSAEARGFAWSYWEFAAGFGAYDLGNQQWIGPLADALVPSPDFNGDGVIGMSDYTLWRDGFGDIYTQADFLHWKANYGVQGVAWSAASIPEPVTLSILILSLLPATPRFLWRRVAARPFRSTPRVGRSVPRASPVRSRNRGPLPESGPPKRLSTDGGR